MNLKQNKKKKNFPSGIELLLLEEFLTEESGGEREGGGRKKFHESWIDPLFKKLIRKLPETNF